VGELALEGVSTAVGGVETRRTWVAGSSWSAMVADVRGAVGDVMGPDAAWTAFAGTGNSGMSTWSHAPACLRFRRQGCSPPSPRSCLAGSPVSFTFQPQSHGSPLERVAEEYICAYDRSALPEAHVRSVDGRASDCSKFGKCWRLALFSFLPRANACLLHGFHLCPQPLARQPPRLAP
jgi:hypothetical protein